MDDPTDEESIHSQAPVGRILGTTDATPLQFWFAVSPDSYVQLDDVIVTERALPDRPPVTIAGIVTAVRARHEGAVFDSDVFAIAEGTLPAQIQEAAEVTTTRVHPDVYVPPAPGAVVYRAQGKAREEALYFDRMQRKMPIGFGRDGAPIYLNSEFLDGSRGAHVSISGISGVATKTSFATFLLYSLLRCGVLGQESINSRVLIFNVKGEDLLFLDYPNTRLDEATTQAYTRLGLVAGPFPDVRVHAPPRANDSTGTPDVTSRRTGVDAFYWTLAEFCSQRLLPYVFADADDERQQYTMVVHSVTSYLVKVAVPAEGGIAIGGRRLSTYTDLVDFIVDQLSDDETRCVWAGSAVGVGTVNAFSRRLIASKKDLSRLVRGDLATRKPHQISTADSAQVTVVDLHNLPERAQRFVVGVILNTEFENKERKGDAHPLLFVVLDELNKYAPREGTSPIKEILLDIAERGRSLGIILIGAQQTASEVERRIVSNSAIRVVGRLDSAEASRPEYGFLPPAQRQRALLATPGMMFVSQPEIPVPLCIEFPFPSWATRPAEAGAAPLASIRSAVQRIDPFAVIGSSSHGLSDDDIPF